MDELLANALTGLNATLINAANAYGTIQKAKTDTYLAKAQASAAAYGLPNAYQNPQAGRAASVVVPGVGSLSGVGMVLAVVVFAGAVYLAVRD